MANITGNWDKTKPAGSDPISSGDDRLRTHWGSLEDTLEEEHYFDDSPTSAGIHKAGASRISYGNLTSLKTTPEEGRSFYAVDDQSLHLTGVSATTKLAGSQQGGPVRSAVSDTFGWYITSYRTVDQTSDNTYLWANSNGNPMTYREGSVKLLTFSCATTGPSTVTNINVPITWSLQSSGVKVQIATWDSELGAAAGVGTFTDLAAGNLYCDVAAMGLIPVSEMS